jgi:hypothetical protein
LTIGLVGTLTVVWQPPRNMAGNMAAAARL